MLRLDPRGGRAPGADHLQVTLIDPGRPLDELMPIALSNRPEIASRRANRAGGRGKGPPRESTPVHTEYRPERVSDALRS